MKQEVPCFVLLKGIQGPFSIKGSFNFWTRAIPLTQLGVGQCYFAKLDKQSFEYKYCSKNAIEPGYNRVYRDNRLDKDPIIIDNCLGRTPFYAGDLLIALANVLHSGQQYIKDVDFLCRVTRSIFDMAVAEQFVVDCSAHELTRGISFWGYHNSSSIVNHFLQHNSDHSILFPVFSALSGHSSFHPDFNCLSHHQHFLSQGLRSFKDQSLPSFLRLASSPFPRELSHQFCAQLIDVLPRSYLSLKVHDTLHEQILSRLQRNNNSLLLAKFLFRNWKDDLLSSDNFVKSIGLIIRQNPHALAFVATHLNNNAQFWDHLKKFKYSESVVQAIPVIVEFFKLDSKTQKVLIVILREFAQKSTVHNMFHLLVLGLPKIFNGWSETPEILRYLVDQFPRISSDSLETLREAYIVLELDIMKRSKVINSFMVIKRQIEDTWTVTDIVFVATHFNNNYQFWENLQKFKHPESVVQALEFFKLDSETQKVLIFILQQFAKNSSVHIMFQTLALGLPKIFKGGSETPEILNYLNYDQFWDHLKKFKHSESVVQAIPVIVEFFKLDSKTQNVCIFILREFAQKLLFLICFTFFF
ncbi:hypothetical protein GEMRC1_001763 [Eukaryota sp. GEM-RC1]